MAVQNTARKKRGSKRALHTAQWLKKRHAIKGKTRVFLYPFAANFVVPALKPTWKRQDKCSHTKGQVLSERDNNKTGVQIKHSQSAKSRVARRERDNGVYL